MLPKARRDKLLVQEVEDELVVYDQDTHRAHRLNRTAALVWRRCDGRTTMGQVTAELETTLGVAAGEDLVRLALKDLERAHLLRERAVERFAGPPMSRREAMAKLGLAAAVAFPVVATLVAPTPTMAQTLSPTGDCARDCHGLCMSAARCARDLARGNCKACVDTGDCDCGIRTVCCKDRTEDA